MSRSAPHADGPASLPEVVLEIRQGSGRQHSCALSHVDFVIGTVPGCDLRVPGAELPALLCVLSRYPGGLYLRKLATTPVMLLNGAPAASTDLTDGDRLTIGVVDVVFRVKPVHVPLPIGEDASATPALPADVEQARHDLHEKAQHLRAELVKLHETKEAAAQEQARLERERAAIEAERSLWQGRRAEVEAEVRDLLRRREQADATLRESQREAPAAAALHGELEQRAALLTQLVARLEAERRAFQEARTGADDEDARRRDELERRERTLDEKTRAYQADVVRLHRQQATIEEREQALSEKSQDTDARHERMQRESADLEEQVVQLDEWRARLAEQADALAKQKQEQDARAAELSQRDASLEGQQAALATLRSRLERLRDTMRGEEQDVDQARGRLEAAEVELSRKRQELEQLRFEVDSERQRHTQERQQWVQRGAVMEAAVRQMRQAQEHLAQEEARIDRQAEELDGRLKQAAEQEDVLHGKIGQLADAQARLEAERQALRERSLALMQGEEARAALQEQLRRRAEELDARQAALAAQVQECQTKLATLEERRAGFEQYEREARQQLDALRLDLDARGHALNQQQAELIGIEQRYQGQAEEIKQLRRDLAEERLRFQQEQQQALESLALARTDHEALRRDALELERQLPELELRAGTALERLGHAREQLRGHLAEIHQYVRQCQDDLEQWRSRLRADLDQLQEQEQSLRRGQDEHRLALAGFRQQLIDWQGQVAEMRRLLAQGETRLERREARVEQQVRAIDETSQKLARQAEELDQQQRAVADRRVEVDRHLGDMRAWYRGKLRELAGVSLVPGAAPPEPPPVTSSEPSEDGEEPIVPVGRSILTLPGPADAGDQRLGDVLRELQLIDADTLTALLAEARRQRRSLRQVLLASGAVTLFQLALIEAGNLTGLMLGPVRVIDRLRSSPHEMVYRVFDPRRGCEAVLRHLNEAHMLDAVRPDEFRQRFRQAILSEPHLVNTLEVMEVHARPAALHELIAGLPATDWPPLTVAPGVCCRLLTQAALGLAAAHRAGLAHGHLADHHLLLTAEGTLKVSGVGEPPWLVGQAEEEADFGADLKALGRIASGWCTPTGVRRGARAKPLPEALVTVLYRLAAEGDACYRDAAHLLEDLERAAADVPANTEAWDRLLRYVREHGSPEAALRLSA